MKNLIFALSVAAVLAGHLAQHHAVKPASQSRSEIALTGGDDDKGGDKDGDDDDEDFRAV